MKYFVQITLFPCASAAKSSFDDILIRLMANIDNNLRCLLLREDH